MKRTIAVLLLVLSMVTGFGLTGCAPKVDAPAEKPAAAPSPITVTDLAGRTVEIPAVAERVVAIGPGALRLLCYAGVAGKVVGVEEFETRPPFNRPYSLANPSLRELPVVGAGGPDSAPDAERLLAVDPDVVFIAQLADASAADELQKAIGVPVIVLSYGQLGNFNEDVMRSLKIIGEVAGTTERVTAVVAFIEGILEDLSARTSGIAEADKPSVYVGALGFKGARGIDSTQGDYPPFSAIGANSVTAKLGQKGSVMIDKEQLVAWNPDYVFLDRSGLKLVSEDVAANRDFYGKLSAFKNGKVYAQIPFNNYWTNVELALANAYYAGTVMFPDVFSDVDPAAKTDEISTFLLGKPVYEQLVESYKGGFGPVDLLGEKR